MFKDIEWHNLFDSKKPIHYWLYLLCLLGVMVGLTISKVLVSVAEITLAANWLLDYKNVLPKFKAFFKNKTAVLITSVMLLHIVSVFYSDNLAYAWKDIRIKAPMFFFPIIISTSPAIKKTHLKYLLLLFVFSVIISTLISTGIYYGIFTSRKVTHPIVDVRVISIFVSHIRLGLIIDLCVIILIWSIVQFRNRYVTLASLVAIGWLVYFLLFLTSLTGIFILLIALSVLGFWYLFRLKRKKLALSILLATVGLILFTANKVYVDYNKTEAARAVVVNTDTLTMYTARGNLYEHDITDYYIENGNHVRMFLCFKELEEEWHKYSNLDIYGLDRKGNKIKYTLARFLTSKGLRKDAEGLSRLSAEEIRMVENGVVNVKFVEMNKIELRLMQTVWELDNYRMGGNPEQHSVAQRLEFWKCAIHVFKNNWLIGVGVGDLEDAYKKGYAELKTKMNTKVWLHAHNQFLAIAAGFGSVGLLLFIASLVFPVWWENKTGMFLYMGFLIIVGCSFFNEDTLETLAGATFFSIFNSLFVFFKDEPTILVADK